MKISLALGPRAPLSRQTAWGCFTTNLALPGIGSLMAGRKAGYGQAALGFGGMGLSVLFGLPFMYWCLANWSRLYGDQADPVTSMAELWSHVRWALVGISLFGAGWLWALATSCAILHVAPGADPPPPLLPPHR
jgi:hypothetical protein